MRFQQLNRDPNSIMRKKLVKSKKNWIVVSSLSFAGGLLLLGGPTEIVHAADTTVAPTEQVTTPTSSDSKTDATKTDSTKSADVTKAVAPVTTEENTDSTVQSDTVAPVEKETATTEKTDATDTNAVSETLNKETTTPDVEETGTTSEAQPVVAKDAQTTAESENTEVPVSSPDVKDTQTTTEDVKNIDGEKVDTPVPDSDIATDETTDTTQSDVNKENVIQNDGTQDDILAANLAVSKAQLASLGISAEDLTLTPETEVLADGNIAEGTQGETPWTIDADGVLHLGTAGKTTTLSKNTITDTSTSGSTTTTPTTSETPTSNTSSWNKYANNVKVIQFDGAVKGSDDISNMFSNFNNLTDITNITNLDLTETSNASGLFMNNPKLTGISQNSTVGTNKVDLTENDLSNLTNVSSMFMNDSSIVNLELPSYDVLHNKSKGFRRVTDSSYMFKNDISLVAPKFGSWTMSSNKSTKGMFQNDTNLGDLILNLWIVWNSDIDTGDSSIGEGMFDGAKLSSITFGSSAVFKSYTALPSTSKGWIETGVMNKGEDDITPTNGGKSFAANLKDATDYSGNTLSSMPSQISGMNVKAMRFSPDGVAPDSYNNISMTVQTNLGEQTFTGLEGPLGNAVSVTMPSKPGYTPNFSTVTGTILNENEATTNIYVTYVGNDVNNKSVAVNGPTKDSSTSFVINNAKIGDTVTITPIVSGYTVTPGSATISADKDGNPVVTVNTQPTYTGNDVNNKSVDVNGPTKDASTSFVINNAKIGDTVAITPTVPGYTVTPGSATITADKDGNPVVTVNTQPTYTGNDVNGKSVNVNGPTKDSSTNFVINNAKIGDTVAITPTVPGYTVTPGSATITADKDGNPVVTMNAQPTYAGNDVNGKSVDVDGPTKDSSTSFVINNAKIGETIAINPTVPGYTVTPGSATITADKDGNPVVTMNAQPTYAGNDVNGKSVNVNGPTKDSSTSFVINNAKIGDTVAITPTVPGYTVTPGSATITADKDGDPVVTVNTQPTYAGNDVNGKSVDVNGPTKDSSTSFVINNAKIGDTVAITPTVPGYTVTPGSATITADKDGDPVVTVNTQPTYTGNDVNNKSVDVNGPTKDASTSFVINNAKIGDTVAITPTVPGYTVTPGSATITADKDGNPVVTVNTQPTYTGNDVNGKSVNVNGPTKDSSTNFVINNAKIGDTVAITPTVPGYTVTPGSATITADKDGDPVVTVNTQPTYAGNDVNNKSIDVDGPTKDSSTSFIINNAKIGDTVAIAPTVPGYTVTPGSATIAADKDGKPVITNIVQPKYTGNTIASWSTGKNEITTPNNQITVTGTTNSNNEPARIGDTVTIAPEVPGYTISKNGFATIIADENGKPMLSNVTQPIYSANSVSSWSTTENSVKIPTGNTTVSGILNSDGKTTKIGDTVTIAPEVPGYTISKNGSATISADSEGNPVVTVNEQPIYSGNAVKNKLVTVNGPTKDSSADFIINNAKIGDTVAITPTVPGYQVTPGSATVTADKNGNPIVTVNNQPIYIGNDTDPITVNFKTPNGNESYTIPAGKVGDKVTVTVPNDIKGYYPTSSEITGTISDKNTFIPDNIVNISDIKYLGVENKSTTIKLKTPDDKVTSLDIPAGRFGDDPVTITAQNISGYTAPSIIVTFGADGIPTIVDAKTPDKEISTSDTLTYSRIPSSHTIIQKDTEKIDIATPKQNSQNVATYSEKGQILLYTLGEDNKMTAISNYGLAKQSTWYSDEQITVDGIQYLRVATNKWVKASQVYSYQDLNQYVRTYDKTAKVLYKSEDEVINNRILQPNTSWFSDRTTYVINGDKYYRVATNEFVSAKDAYIYQPTNMVVKTHTDSPSKNLYTAKGELITNRSLVADSNWLVDSIVYIEGIKYYRVATNEFVKASDVDINH